MNARRKNPFTEPTTTTTAAAPTTTTKKAEKKPTAKVTKKVSSRLSDFVSMSGIRLVYFRILNLQSYEGARG